MWYFLLLFETYLDKTCVLCLIYKPRLNVNMKLTPVLKHGSSIILEQIAPAYFMAFLNYFIFFMPLLC